MVEFMLQTDHPSGTNIGSCVIIHLCINTGEQTDICRDKLSWYFFVTDDLPWIIRNQSVSTGERRTVHEIETAFLNGKLHIGDKTTV